ncbi:hypothetical protein LCER1_G009398, partial [Lachnellula cervina]
MPSLFTAKDHKRCSHYARFMQHLNVAQANAIFWLLFIAVLVLMCVAAYQHHRSSTIPPHRSRRPPPNPPLPTAHTATPAPLPGHRDALLPPLHLLHRARVLRALQHPVLRRRDLMQLYWGFWSVVQVGSLMAITGVM